MAERGQNRVETGVAREPVDAGEGMALVVFSQKYCGSRFIVVGRTLTLHLSLDQVPAVAILPPISYYFLLGRFPHDE